MKQYLIAMVLTFCVGNSLLPGQTPDSDWPQILGGSRNGVSAETAQLGWSGKPKVAWEIEVGTGFAGPVISGESLILFHRPGGSGGPLAVQKFNAADGKAIWKTDLKSGYEGKMDRDTGPKATPVVQDGFVYCHGPDGELACLNFESGETKWEINAREMFSAPPGYFGCGSSPIVVDGKLLLNVGGKTKGSNGGASIVAFDAATGEVVWQAVKDTASYSSPIAVEHDGKQLAIFLTRTRFVGIDVATGKVQFNNAFGVRGPSAVGAMPVAFGNKVFATAAYNVGAMVVDLEKLGGDGGELKPDWSSKQAFASHYGTPVFHDGYFYGTNGREDFRDGSFRCINAASGEVVWDEPSFPVAHTLRIEDQLLVLNYQGKLSLIKPSPEKFSLLNSATVFDGETRAVPAYSKGRLFFRSNARSNVGKLIAVEVSK